MSDEVVHNPDQYMADFRLLLSQGNKRIALLVGAGASASIRIGDKQEPIIPMIRELTAEVLSKLGAPEKASVAALSKDLGANPNIEEILSKIRLLTRALGGQTLLGLNGEGFEKLGNTICQLIGERVKVHLPTGETPYSHLVSWILGTSRRYGVEIFTPNYDLLIEEALERAHAPYFDGFSGGVLPFFDSATVSNDDLPARWTRVWKLHGSLGWANDKGRVIRTQSRDASRLIYPDHLKYDHTQKQPYAALFDRLKNFLRTPDSLLVTCGFSFSDTHIVSAIEESLAANPLSAVVALQYQSLKAEKLAFALAERRPNLSVYAADGAVINGVGGVWRVGAAANEQWVQIRTTFWGQRSATGPTVFTLGDFKEMARFLALSGSLGLRPIGTVEAVPAAGLPAPPKPAGGA